MPPVTETGSVATKAMSFSRLLLPRKETVLGDTVSGPNRNPLAGWPWSGPDRPRAGCTSDFPQAASSGQTCSDASSAPRSGESDLYTGRVAVIPPSTGMTAPWTYDASSESSQATGKMKPCQRP